VDASPALCQIRGHSFSDELPASPVLVDLGANIGGFSREFLGRFPEARLLLVEADPYLVESLLAEFGRCPRAKLFQGLIGPKTTPRVPFFLSRIPEGNSVHPAFSAHWSEGETRRIEVEMIALPELLARAGFDHVDLLKVDIEGSEWDLLDGLSPTLAQSIGQITVEFHDFMAPELRVRTEATIAHLRQLGYRVSCRGTHLVHGSPYVDCLFTREPREAELKSK
jgi:FkbM family methyltransferase